MDAVLFINDVFGYRKQNDSAFSYAVWAQELGLGNKTVLRFILKKERRISAKSAQLFIKNLRLGVAEAEYFELLISYSQAKSKQERQAFGSSLIKLQRSNYKPLEFQQDQELCNALSPVVLRLFVFDEVGFRISDRPGDPKLRHYHEHWIDKAKLAIDLDPTIRKFRALKFALSEADFISVVERINDFAVSILATYNSADLGERRLYMLETLLFPIANIECKPAERSRPFEVTPEPWKIFIKVSCRLRRTE